MYATMSGSALMVLVAVLRPSWNAMIVPSRSTGSTRAAICAGDRPAQSLLSTMLVPLSSTTRSPRVRAVATSAAFTPP